MALTKASLIDVNGQELILDADADTSITADTDDQIDIKVGGTDTVVITGGAMALKGATPTLTIGDAGAEDTKIVFDGNAQDFYIGLDDSADDLVIGLGSTVGTTPAINIDESLNVGVRSSTAKQFVVNQTGTSGYFLSGEASGTEIAYWYYDANQVQFSSKRSGKRMTFLTEDSEKMRIDSNGDVAIRTTDTTAALTVSQTDNDNPVARFDIACGALNAIVGMQLRVTAGTANAANKYFLQGDDNGNTRVELRTDGSIYSSYYTITSDERLKENIEDCEPMLEKLKQVRIVDFDWKENAGPEGRQRGVIAQEIESIFPELIHQPKEYKEFKKTEMTPILVKAIQEQQEQIEALQSEINTLKGG